MQRRPRSLTARSSPQHPAPPSQTATAAENQTRLSPRPQLRGSPSHQVRRSTQQAAVKRRGSPPAQPRTACSLCPAGTKHLVRPESTDRKPRTRAQSRAACLPCTHGPMEGLGGRARNKTQGGVRLSWAFSVMRTFCSVLFCSTGKMLLGVSLAGSTRADGNQTWTSQCHRSPGEPTKTQHSHASLLHHPRTKKREGSLMLKPPGEEPTPREHGKSGGQCPPGRLCAPRPCQQCRPSPSPARRQCRQGTALKQVETRCFLTRRTQDTKSSVHASDTALKAHTPGTFLPPSDTVPPLGGARPGTQAACHTPPVHGQWAPKLS